MAEPRTQRSGVSGASNRLLRCVRGSDNIGMSIRIANLRLGIDRRYGPLNLRGFVRLDNVFDRQYVGSVIVGDSNNRFYESAPGRNWLAGVSARYTF